MSLAERQEGVTLTVCCLLTSLLKEREISCVIFGILLYFSFNNKVHLQGSLCHFGNKG